MQRNDAFRTKFAEGVDTRVASTCLGKRPELAADALTVADGEFGRKRVKARILKVV